MIKYIKYSILFVIISIALTITIHFLIKPYKTIENELNFTIENSKNNELISIVKYNCEKADYDLGFSCNKLIKDKDYSINVLLDISNKLETNDTINYILELEVNTISHKKYNYQKVFYFEKKDDISEFINKMIEIPLRVTGYKIRRGFDLEIVKSYLNKDENTIDNIKVELKNKNINIAKGSIILKPLGNFFINFYGKYKIIIIPIIFSIIFIIQMFFFILIRFSIPKTHTE